MNKEKFILDSFKNPRWAKDAHIILDSDDEMERFLNEILHDYDNLDNWIREHRWNRKVKLDAFRLGKIKRMNLSKETFVSMYNEDARNAYTTLFQQFVNFVQFSRLQEGLMGESIDLFYDTFILSKTKKVVHFYPIRESYEELKKEYYKEQQKKVIPFDAEPEFEDNQPINTFSTKNQTVRTTTINKMVRVTKLATSLKELYHHQCQVCKNTVQTRSGMISESHHIQPYNETHKGDDCWGNMIVVCPNCHSQFDDLYFAIEPETFILHCYDKTHEYHGMQIQTLPEHTLGNQYLTYAWKLFQSN